MEKMRKVKKMIVKGMRNVLGEIESDPVCDYLTCYHAFSIHGHRSHEKELNCVCKQPRNLALGVRGKK